MRLSLVIMAYSQEDLIEETIAAALAQDYQDLEIVLSDDASPDKTYQIMSEMAAGYAGRHQIILNRNPINLGLVGHVNYLFHLATSDWIIYNAGDDLSESNRVRRIAESIQSTGPHYVYSNVTDLDSIGLPLEKQRQRTRPEILERKELPELARTMSHALGASSAWHRQLFDLFGPITEKNVFEDQILMFRARLIGKVSYIDERLLRYRRSIGLSFQSKDDLEKKLNSDIAVLQQRRRDVLAVAPHRKDILTSIDRKLKRREGTLKDFLENDIVPPSLPDADE